MNSKITAKKSRKRKYIEVTPQLLAVLAVERIVAYMSVLATQLSNWWFAIQDIDLALNAQMIAFLSGTGQLGALVEGHQKKFSDYHNDGDPNRAYPVDKNGEMLKGRIADFSALLKRAEDPNFGFINNSQSFLSVSEKEKRDILKFHEFRSDIAHPRPLTWSVQAAGLPRMASACIRALEHLFGHSTQRIHLSATQNKLMARNLKSISKKLKTMA